ncbi:TetR/AcrR family transcriptional regulator [Pseudonocardia sp. GCM10023141]|uniref:TetR/AcrR family transcriptional regulator n=1 Tax=Pseudonocardia sp. GCM10023141 TaxID=3252653 RepID=UPI00361D89A0
MAPEQRRAAIIAASLPLVLEHGLDVSTRQLADAAGVAEGTLFRVFPDKEALLWAVVGAAMDPDDTLRELKSVDRGLVLRQRLVACVEVMQGRLSGVFNLLDALRLKGPPPEHVRSAQHRNNDEINSEFHAAIVDLIGPDTDQLRVPAAQLAHIMRLLVFSATHPHISDGHPLTATEIVSVLLDGLASHPELPPPGTRPNGRAPHPPTED